MTHLFLGGLPWNENFHKSIMSMAFCVYHSTLFPRRLCLVTCTLVRVRYQQHANPDDQCPLHPPHGVIFRVCVCLSLFLLVTRLRLHNPLRLVSKTSK